MANVNETERSFFDERVGQHFIDATRKTIELYFGQTPQLHPPRLSNEDPSTYDVAATVRFHSHEVEASMVLAVRKDFAIQLYEHMVGDKVADLSGDVADCMGEMANVIYGMAKAPLVDQGFEFPMSRPSTTLDPKSIFAGAKWLELPFHMGSPAEKPFALVLVVHRFEWKSAAA